MDELERFKREISLAEVAESEGYELDRRASSRASWVMRHPDGDKILVSTDADGHGVFCSVHSEARGSVIDFIMRRRGITLGQARQYLRRWLTLDSFPTAPRRLESPASAPRERPDLLARWHALPPCPAEALVYRGLTPATVAVFAERLRRDERGNCAFRHDHWQGLTGWELKNHGFTGFAAGGTKALFGARVGVARRDPLPRIVVTESAIDAMSVYQLQPESGLYLSFAGSLSEVQQQFLAEVLTRYPEATVLTATDNDPQGEDYAQRIARIRPDAIRHAPPQGKDWNEALQLHRLP